MKRVKQRKLRTLAAKSLSNAIINNFNEPNSQRDIPIENYHKNEKEGDYFGSCILLEDTSAKK